jgi:hypothetical protein
MPLAKTAVLDWEKADLLSPKNVNDFVNTNAYKDLESLEINIKISDYCIEKIISSGTFSHLKTLVTSNVYYQDTHLEKRLSDWKKIHNIN